MKTLSISLCGIVIFAIVGCSKSTTRKAAEMDLSDQSTEPKTTVVMKPILGEDTFTMSVPLESIALKRGEESPVRIEIKRGLNFREDVAISLTDLPSGVTLVTADSLVSVDTTETTLMLKVANDAELGEFTAAVTGQTENSVATFTKELKMTVAEK